MMLVRTYVGPSPIEGLGVFAAEAIRRGQEVWRFDPRFDKLIRKADLGDASSCVQEYLARYAYDFHQDSEYMLCDIDDAIYMNHSGRPNVDLSNPDCGVATSDIRSGTELTCDYSTFMNGSVLLLGERNRPARVEQLSLARMLAWPRYRPAGRIRSA
jgi:hypothetical protein